MKKSMVYIIGIITIIVVFGFMMIKGETVIGDSYTAQVVDGVQEVVLEVKSYNYYPNIVKVKEGIPVRIYLDQTVSGCLRDFTVREFGVRKYLKTPEDYIEFTPDKKGKYAFACSMGMGTGVLIVE